MRECTTCINQHSEYCPKSSECYDTFGKPHYWPRRTIIKVSLKARLKQFFCKHDSSVNLSCATTGINSMEGQWYLEYNCGDCGMSYGEWIKADREVVNEIFRKQVITIK